MWRLEEFALNVTKLKCFVSLVPAILIIMNDTWVFLLSVIYVISESVN